MRYLKDHTPDVELCETRCDCRLWSITGGGSVVRQCFDRGTGPVAGGQFAADGDVTEGVDATFTILSGRSSAKAGGGH